MTSRQRSGLTTWHRRRRMGVTSCAVHRIYLAHHSPRWSSPGPLSGTGLGRPTPSPSPAGQPVLGRRHLHQRTTPRDRLELSLLPARRKMLSWRWRRGRPTPALTFTVSSLLLAIAAPALASLASAADPVRDRIDGFKASKRSVATIEDAIAQGDAQAKGKTWQIFQAKKRSFPKLPLKFRDFVESTRTKYHSHSMVAGGLPEIS